jgi:hypothetical protein
MLLVAESPAHLTKPTADKAVKKVCWSKAREARLQLLSWEDSHLLKYA